MNYLLHHHAGAVSPEAVGTEPNRTGPVIKIGLDVHASFYVAVAQHDHATPGAPRRFAPAAFVPWLSSLLVSGQPSRDHQEEALPKTKINPQHHTNPVISITKSHHPTFHA